MIHAPTAFWSLDAPIPGSTTVYPDLVTLPAECRIAKSGVITPVAGKIGGGLSNANSYYAMKCPNPPLKMNPGGGAWSWWGWIKPDALTADCTVFELGANTAYNGFLVNLNAGNQRVDVQSNINATHQTKVSSNDNVVVAGEWLFIAVVFDAAAGTLSLSINGGPQLSVLGGSFTYNAFIRMFNAASDTKGFKGSMDSIAYFAGYAATPDEIIEAYNSGAGKTFNGTDWV